MRVFLGNPPWIKENRLGVRAGSRWPFTQKVRKNQKIPNFVPFPFFLAYAAAVLERNNQAVLLVDAIAEGLDDKEFIEKIKKFEPRLVLLETSTPSIDSDLKTAEKIKNEANCLICLSGPHTTVFGEQLLKSFNFIDFILVGEYEYTLNNLVKSLEQNKNLKKVKGLIFRKGNKIINNGRAPLIKNLDKLPWPARHFLPMHNYRDEFASRLPMAQMWTSRGCPHRCIFCLWPKVIYGSNKYRVRGPKDIADEMEHLVKKWGYKFIFFDDDTFNVNKQRVLRICDEIKRRKPLKNIKLAVMARADLCDYEMLEALKGAGLYAIKYGVESGVQELVDNLNKNLDLEKVRETVKLTKKLGIKVHLAVVFGSPGETKKTIDKTIKFILELNPDSVQFSILTPFPGTKYFEMLDRQGMLIKKWSNYDGLHSCIVNTKYLKQKDIEEALHKAYKIWRRHEVKKLFSLNHIAKGLSHPIKAFREIAKLNSSRIT